MDGRIEKGRLGEELAEKFLIEHGFKVLEKNFRTRVGEIDLVCKDSNTIVFVEVKTRENLNFGLPEEAVDYRKQIKIKKVASIYINSLNKDGLNINKFDYRFDVVSVMLDSKVHVKSIKIINNAF